MNLSSLNIFRSLQTETKQFAVIGLGRFGRAVCETLHNAGYEVMAIDRQEKNVDEVMNDRIASHAATLDSMDYDALKQTSIEEFDTVIVAIGNFLAESVTTTLNLKELGVNFVVAKASSETHSKLLKKVGADLVVFPEREMGCELARRLSKPTILEQLDIDPEHSIVQLKVPNKFDGKTISQLELRNKYGFNILAVSSRDNHFEINPSPNTVLRKNTDMIVLGNNKDIERLPN
jgi:trk system potassium uptake protein TrkA